MSPTDTRRLYDGIWSVHSLSILLADAPAVRTDGHTQALAVALECVSGALLAILSESIRPADAGEDGFE